MLAAPVREAAAPATPEMAAPLATTTATSERSGTGSGVVVVVLVVVVVDDDVVVESGAVVEASVSGTLSSPDATVLAVVVLVLVEPDVATVVNGDSASNSVDSDSGIPAIATPATTLTTVTPAQTQNRFLIARPGASCEGPSPLDLSLIHI